MKKPHSTHIAFAIALAALLAHAAETTLVNGDFELDAKGWTFPECARTEAFAGIDGTAALVLRRTAAPQNAAVTQPLTLRPGRAYTLEAWVKTDALVGPPPAIHLHFATGKKGKSPLPGATRSLQLPTDAPTWTRLRLDFTMPSDATAARLSIDLPAQTTGTLWLDALAVTPADYPVALALLFPHQGIIDDHTSLLRIAVTHPGAPDFASELLHWTLRLNHHGRPQTLRAAAPIVEFPIEIAPEQDLLTATVELLDNDTQRILDTLRVTLRRRSAPLAFDSRQRLLIQQQPVFPVGLATTSPAPPTDASFRFLLPTPSALAAINTPDDLRQFLDDALHRDQRVILPLDSPDCFPWLAPLPPDLRREHLLATFASHPALLAWQLQPAPPDEPPSRALLQDAPQPIAQRLDGTRFPANYLRSCDLLLGEVATARPDQPPDEALAYTRSWTRELQATGRPVWMTLRVPDHATPAPNELRAHALLLAALGVNSIYFVDNKKLTSSIKDLAAILDELSPYLLSNLSPRDLPLTIRKGDAIAREFTDHSGRRVILLIGGFLPGKTHAILNLPPDAHVTSRFGLAKPRRNGAWHFQATGPCADLLYLAPR